VKKPGRTLLLVGSAADCPDIEYATRFRATDSVVLLQARGRLFLVVPRMEEGRARRAGGRTEVVTPEELGVDLSARRGVAEWALALLRRERVRRVHVPGGFPWGVARRLEEGGVRLCAARGDVFEQRAVKTQDEQRAIAESQQAAVIAMRAAIAMIAGADVDAQGFLKRGARRLTAEDVRRSVGKVLLEHDCFCRDVIVAGGRQAADPHGIGCGPLRAHETIVIDIFPQHLRHGYWGDLTRTVVKGTAPPALRILEAAVRRAQAAALARIRSGVKCRSVHRAAVREFERCGLRTSQGGDRGKGFIHGTGHGLGLAVHESPSLSPNDRRLRSGNVVTVEPGLYYPDVGGVRIEDTVVVTPTGWRYLAPCEKPFEV
jgi:Xaa-Pro aminopeptidase